MEKEFVPYEQALELKELGFDGDCFAIWSGFDESNFSTTDTVRLFSSKFRINDTQSSYSYTNSPNYNQVSAPTFQQAFRWLREKYMLSGEIYIFKNIWNFDIEDISNSIQLYTSDIMCYNSYEEAELACSMKLIEIAKEQNVK